MRFSCSCFVPFAILALTSTAACSRRAETEIGTGKAPLILELAHGIAKETDVVRLAGALAQETGLAWNVRTAKSSVEAIQAFGSRRADVGLLPVFEYLLARQEYGVLARLQVVRDDQKTVYQGEILVKADSSVSKLEDLQGKKLAYADPYSMSGFLLPAKMLAAAHLRPIPVFAGTHENALNELMTGRVDAAATYVGAVSEQQHGLRRLATTEAVPNEPVFIRRDLDLGLAQKVVEGLQRLAAKQEGRQVLHAVANIHGFAPVGDAAYAGLSPMIRAAGSQLEELVPGGWIVWQSNRSDMAP